MKTRGRQQAGWTNPVLIGAVTVLFVVVAVFLAYNSNLGLPFVPTKELKVNLSNGSDLVVGNNVSEGGYLIGLITALQPVHLADGTIGAQATLQLSEADGNVPINSHVTVYSKSALGLKYLDLVKGNSRHFFPEWVDDVGCADGDSGADRSGV
jgi:ABC-type transporter Mla subunit MlaD